MAVKETNRLDRATVPLLRAILLLMLDYSTPEHDRSKPEILLHRAGLTNKDIASLLGKNEEAVRKAIQRDRVQSTAPSP